MTKTQEQFKRDFEREVQATAKAIEKAARKGRKGIARYFDFEDMLDIEFRINGRMEYRGAVVTLALGGPTIIYDTKESCVKGYWGSDYSEAYVSRYYSEEIDEYLQKEFEMIRESY